jgi:hypothetical protein
MDVAGAPLRFCGDGCKSRKLRANESKRTTRTTFGAFFDDEPASKGWFNRNGKNGGNFLSAYPKARKGAGK